MPGMNSGVDITDPLVLAAFRSALLHQLVIAVLIFAVLGAAWDAGHLHPDLNMGFVEVAGLDGTGLAAPGELGRMVVTPYFPYRDCMALLRYDTADLVRRLPDGPPGCELAGIPAVSAIQGKASEALVTASGTVTTRDIVEVLEGLPSQPWPARYRATELGGVLLLTIPQAALDGLTTAEVVRRFAERGIEAAVEVSSADLRHVRADLAEATFAVDAVTTGG